MLCNLLGRGGVDDTKLWTNDDIRDGGVGFGIPVALGYQTVPVYDVLNLEFCSTSF